jgi:large subunit ribosomal protein L1
MYKGKNYWENCRMFDNKQKYSLDRAYSIIQKMKSCKFDESVDMTINVKQIKSIPTNCSADLPYGNGKNKKILLVLQNGDENENYKKTYNVDEVVGENWIQEVKNGNVSLKYDYIVTEISMLVFFKGIAKILGPKHLMPTVKNGLASTDVHKTIDNIRSGKLNFKIDKYGNIQLSIGRKSFPFESIKSNYKSLIKTVIKSKPSSIKASQYITSIHLSTTMSPSIRINDTGENNDKNA